MNTATKAITAIGLITLLAPLGQSTWSVAGNIEPNSVYDTDTWMWTSGQTTPAIYFNVWSQSAPAGVAGASPNVAAIGTQVESPSNEIHRAIFGVWLDCNGDGYVGLAEQGLREYPAAILLDNSVCPPVTGDINTWTEGAHNYNGWVSEYVPIVRDNTNADGEVTDARVYVDADAMVWGDYGKPDEHASFRSCALAPQPRGTYQSTGGAYNYVECRFEQNGIDSLGTFNGAMDAIGDPLGLKFQDTDDARTGTLGQIQNPAGTEDSSHSPAHLADCSADPLLNVGDAINSTGANDDGSLYALDEEEIDSGIWTLQVPALAPSPGNLDDPTVPAFYNETNEAVAGDCDTTNDPGHDFYGNDKLGTGLPFYVGEEDFNGVSSNNKHESDWNFNSVVGARGDGEDTTDALALGIDGAAGAPGDYGIGWTSSEGGWSAPSVYASKLGPRTLKVDLANGQVGVSRPWWLTYYAHAGAATTGHAFAKPSGSGEYAAWQCGEAETGIPEHSGWNCDVNTWYLNQDGSHYPEDFRFARPGDAYEFRDVDCYDGRVGNTGVGVEPAFYGDEPCA